MYLPFSRLIRECISIDHEELVPYSDIQEQSWTLFGSFTFNYPAKVKFFVSLNLFDIPS